MCRGVEGVCEVCVCGMRVRGGVWVWVGVCMGMCRVAVWFVGCVEVLGVCGCGV